MTLTQTERVLAALVGNQAHGITAADFLRYPAIDGGPPITRLAARIDELRRGGHNIVSGERRQKCVVYRILVTGVSPGSASAPLSPPALVGSGEAPVACSEPRARENADASTGDGSLHLFAPPEPLAPASPYRAYAA